MFRWPLVLIAPALCAGAIRTLVSLPNAQIVASVVDSAGALYLTGNIGSNSLPVTPGAFQTQFHGGTCGGEVILYPCKDGFVAKIDQNGRIVYATYLGGGNEDLPYAIAVDSAGNAYVGGFTASSDFPLAANHLAAEDKATSFIAKLDQAGSKLLFSTRLPALTAVHAVAVDRAGVVYVTAVAPPPQYAIGTIPSTPGALNPGPSQSDVLLKLSPPGDRVIYATYLPGSNPATAVWAQGGAIAVDSEGNMYVAGTTTTTDFPITPGSVDTRPPGKDTYSDAFVLKLNPAGTHIVYAARPSGSCNDNPAAMAVDSSGRVFVAGSTCSQDYPVTAGAIKREIGLVSSNAFLTVLSADGASLEYSTYLGGSQGSAATSIALDKQSRALVSGWTDDMDFPTTVDAPVRCNSAPLSSLANKGAPLFIRSAFFLRLDFENPAAAFATYLDASGGPPPAGYIADPPLGINTTSGLRIVGVDSRRPSGTNLQCVANAASGWSSTVTPGEVVTLYGSGLGPSVPQQGDPSGGVLATTLAGVRVYFGGIAAPLLTVGDDRVSAVVPFELAPQSNVAVQVERDSVLGDLIQVPFAAIAPAIFQSAATNRAFVVNQDQSINSPSNPAKRGSVISFWATGLGPMLPSVTDGLVTPVGQLSAPVAPVKVGFFGWTGDVVYNGAAPGAVAGVVQINARVPDQMGPFSYPVDLSLFTAWPYITRVTIFIQ